MHHCWEKIPITKICNINWFLQCILLLYFEKGKLMTVVRYLYSISPFRRNVNRNVGVKYYCCDHIAFRRNPDIFEVTYKI